jgi:hypothetical protein
MRPLPIITLLLLLGLILLPGALLFAISSATPLAEPARQVTPEVAREVKQLARQMQFGIYYLRRQTLSLSAEDIRNLFAVAARAMPRLTGDARISARGSEIRMTLHLPENPFGDYINLRLGLPATAAGLMFDHLAIGNITLNGDNARRMIEMAANLAFGGDEGSRLLASVKQLRSSRERLTLTYQPTPHLDEKVATALKRLQPWRNEVTTAETAAIRHYYAQLCSDHYTSAVTLGQPLSATLKRAAARSRSAQAAAAENRAALLALAIFFGSERFNTLVNAIDNDTLKQCQRAAPAATLAGRHDLARHFLYSAAIKIIADSQMSFAMGELKEMVDSLQGGSGFSFADLAADQSGIRFAELASAPESARSLHAAAGELAAEARFFPAISGLAEAIPQQQFEQQYGGTAGSHYNQQLDEIKRRIEALALYHSPQ